MISVREAQEIVFKNAAVLDSFSVPLTDSLDYAAAEDIFSGSDIPGADNSAMDGYAVRVEDLQDAGIETPEILEVVGEVPAGEVFDGKIKRGQAISIMTGGVIPGGANAVVKIEDTQQKDEKVIFFSKPKAGENIRKAGEDIKRGDTLIRKGELIGPAEMGMLASTGNHEVQVIRKPKVSLLVTGNELIEADDERAPGKVRNSNRYTLSGLLAQTGAEFEYLGKSGDSRKDITAMLEKTADSDIVITSGGVSVGKYDFVGEALTELGMQTHFWKVAQRPGKPLLFGTIDNRLVFGLPGNPVSVMVSFLLYVRPAIKRMQGLQDFRNRRINATLTKEFTKDKDFNFFARGVYSIENGAYTAEPLPKQGSGILRSMNLANCLIVFPAGTEFFQTGTIVDIIVLE